MLLLTRVTRRGTSNTLKARAFLDRLAFCGPSPLDYMRVVSGTGRGVLAMISVLHESSFRVPSDYYMMAAHRVIGLTPSHASHVRKCPR
jgi:hypothetical protein